MRIITLLMTVIISTLGCNYNTADRGEYIPTRSPLSSTSRTIATTEPAEELPDIYATASIVVCMFYDSWHGDRVLIEEIDPVRRLLIDPRVQSMPGQIVVVLRGELGWRVEYVPLNADDEVTEVYGYYVIHKPCDVDGDGDVDNDDLEAVRQRRGPANALSNWRFDPAPPYGVIDSIDLAATKVRIGR